MIDINLKLDNVNRTVDEDLPRQQFVGAFTDFMAMLHRNYCISSLARILGQIGSHVATLATGRPHVLDKATGRRVNPLSLRI